MTSQNRQGVKATESLDRTERKTLLIRVGIAGLLIVTLIGALALFEQQQSEPEPAEPGSMKLPDTSQSLPAPGSPNQASGEIAPPAGPPTEPVAKPEAPAEPERTGAPQIAEPATPGKATGGTSVIEKESQTEDKHPRLVVGMGGEPSVAAKASPAVQSAPIKPATTESKPVAGPTAGGGFLVQVGVFFNLSNAEELRKKLVDAGIPAQIEARVQVGPFATKAEAAAVQQKLKSLGVEPGMLLRPRR